MAEKKALNDLDDDDTIIIKPADKGGSIVMMDCTNYHNGMCMLLSDKDSYEKSDHSTLRASQAGIKAITDLGKTNGWVDQKTAENLFDPYPSTSVLYGLPKIHKGLNPLTFRPIVSGTGSATQPLAKFVDHFLQPLVLKLPAYLLDTNDFLSKLSMSKHVKDDWVMVLMDISLLYTCIPNQAGLRTAEIFLQNNVGLDIPSAFYIALFRICFG